MKMFSILLILATLVPLPQDRHTVTKKGWLVYHYGDQLAFFALKDQSRQPTYRNFFTEEKQDGERMNGNYSAAEKLLIAKTYWIDTYEPGSGPGKGTRARTYQFYIQPVKYLYEVDDLKGDSTDHVPNGAGGWAFL